MNNHVLLHKAQELVDLAGIPVKRDLRISYANRFFNAVADSVRELGASRLPPWTKEWAPKFRAMVDQFDKEAKRDPCIMYTPAHFAAEQYHRSKARRLYAKCANAVGKTQMGFAEDYRILTGQDPHGKYPDIDGARNMVLASLEHTKYGKAVFEAKLLNGETNNYLSPMFPDGGKWLHKYDSKSHTIWIKCPRCANDPRQPLCKEPSFFQHFSQEGGWEGFQGGAYAAVHVDEHICEEFYDEAEIRVERSDYIGRIFVTGTPLFGRNAWEIQRLQGFVKNNPENNKVVLPRTGEVVPRVEIIHITQAQAGFKTPEQIEMARLSMSKSKFKARYEGLEVPDVKNAVFDDELLEPQEDHFVRTPEYGELEIIDTDDQGDPILQGQYDPEPGEPLDDLGLSEPKQLRWLTTSAGKEPDVWTGYRVWQKPVLGEQYIMGVDIAAGMAQESHDASCCHVFRLYMNDYYDICMEQVAQFYGWINPHELAKKVKRLGTWYNNAMAVVEITGGLGQMHIMRLKELAYPAIFRNGRDPAIHGQQLDPREGVDTNVKTKPMFISAALHLMSEGRVILRDKETLMELRSFVQKTTDGGTVKYQAADSAHDDRVTSFLFPCFVVTRYPLSVYMPQEDLELADAGISDSQRAQIAVNKAVANWSTGDV